MKIIFFGVKKSLQRFRKLRTRWKVLVFLLFGAIAAFIIWARQPEYEIKLTDVIKEGEWLRLEFDVTNLTRYECKIFETAKDEMMLWPVYENKFLDLYEDMEVGVVDPHTDPIDWGTFEDGSIAPDETRKGFIYLHSAYGGNSFEAVPMLFQTPRESYSSKAYFYINQYKETTNYYLGHHQEKVPEIISRLRNSSIKLLSWAFLPAENPTPCFIPNEKISSTSGPSLLEEATGFLDRGIPETAQFVVNNDGFKSLKSFVNSNGETSNWVGIVESRDWVIELDWWIKSGVPETPSSYGLNEAKTAREELKKLGSSGNC